MKIKLIRVSTVSISLDILLKGQLSFLNNYFKVIAIAEGIENLQIIKKREGIEVKNIPFKRNISLIVDVISLFKLYIYLIKEKPTIIHSVTPKAGLISMLAGKLAGVPFRIHTFTGLVFPSKKGLLKQVLIIMDKIICYCATNVYPEGNGVKKDLLANNITVKPLKVLANGNVNGIDLDYFSLVQFSEADNTIIKQQLGIKKNDFVFIFVGRLVGDKGINELTTAFSNLKPETLNLKLLLVGPFESELDPLNPETLNAITTNSNIISVGFQSDVRPYFAISDCLVFPSYREGFPNVVMQSGAMGLPSIVTDINGCNEIIEDGVNGLIIPPKNSKALQMAMIKLVEDKELYKNLKSNSRQMITSRYEQKLVWEALLMEYQTLLQEKGLIRNV